MLITELFDDVGPGTEIISEKINGVYCCCGRKYGGDKGTDGASGKIYIDGESPGIGRIAVMGGSLDGKRVRSQRIASGGEEFVIIKFKRVMLDGRVHHIEAEVC